MTSPERNTAASGQRPHVKQVPGRKTDVQDAQWLCQLLEAGLLKPSLVPPKPVRTLRNLTRYRKSQIRDRQREMNRLHKIIQDTGIKLDRMATDMLAKSGRAMLDALVSGTTDPVVLADLARGRLRKKIPALQAALKGRFDAERALVVGRILAHIDYLDEAIDELSAVIEEQLGPFAPAVELPCTIPGVGRRAAEVIIAETGGDMTAFPTAKHLASWAGMCPGNDESAAKRRSGKTRKGSKWLSQTLVECAKSANRSNTYLAAQYARLRLHRHPPGRSRVSLNEIFLYSSGGQALRTAAMHEVRQAPGQGSERVAFMARERNAGKDRAGPDLCAGPTHARTQRR